MADFILKIYSHWWPQVSSAVASLVWLVILIRTRRAAYVQGFRAGAARAADFVANGFDNPNHPIHKLYQPG